MGTGSCRAAEEVAFQITMAFLSLRVILNCSEFSINYSSREMAKCGLYGPGRVLQFLLSLNVYKTCQCQWAVDIHVYNIPSLSLSEAV